MLPNPSFYCLLTECSPPHCYCSYGIAAGNEPLAKKNKYSPTATTITHSHDNCLVMSPETTRLPAGLPLQNC